MRAGINTCRNQPMQSFVRRKWLNLLSLCMLRAPLRKGPDARHARPRVTRRALAKGTTRAVGGVQIGPTQRIGTCAS